MTSEKGSRRDKNQNIQVFVRLRPLNQRERDIKSQGVIEVLNGREVVVRPSPHSIHTKKFTFDRAFGPNTKQLEVYQQVVSPLIKEVLCGYNCTVFAYGQTGTGKTHTMVGESTTDENVNWQNDPLAGIIPRALSQLFDELRISNTEYTVRVSYLELYNEELFDLLSTSEDNSKLRIYEDVTRKGANIVNGLEEITVYNKNEVYKIMEQGQERKRVASTLMNAQSSRSHTVFTIVAHMKENNQEGEELVKIGKLNLVDLAGSENISKAGSDNPAKRERARECVNINQSLLTLGRVITALVERHPHIPYRESKLTRILQESLGGRTKTSIIATVSPGHKDLEETMSTLEYAHRAKNIQNKPEVNQKMTKTAMLKEYAEEIDKLKRDLMAARDKNGVCISNETFAEMNMKDEEQRKEIQELLLKKRAMEEERDRKEAVFVELSKTLEQRLAELDASRRAVQAAKEQLANTNNVLQSTRLHCEEQEHLVGAHVTTELRLSAQARGIMAAADAAAAHAGCLHDAVDKRRMVESTNIAVTTSYRQQAAGLRGNMAAVAQQFVDALAQALAALHEQTDKHTTSSTNTLEDNKQKLEELVREIIEAKNECTSSSAAAHAALAAACEQQRDGTLQIVSAKCEAVRVALQACVAAARDGVQRATQWNAPATIENLVRGWVSDGGQRVSSLRGAHSSFTKRARSAERRRAELARRQRDARKLRVAAAAVAVNTATAKLETEKSLLEDRLAKQLTDIEQERREAVDRLERWAEEERQRLARHVEAETRAIEERLAKRAADVEDQRRLLEERVKSIESWRVEQMAAVEDENKMADNDLTDCEAGGQECLQLMDTFEQDLCQETTAMCADLKAVSDSIARVTGHYNTELMELLTGSTQLIEQEANSAVALEERSAEQLRVRTDDMMAAVLHANKHALDAVLQNVEATASSMVTSLTSITSSTSELAESARSALVAHSTSTEDMRRRAELFHHQLRQTLAQHEDLEGRRLGEEYRIYSPTGKTPVRQEYRFPRSLAATSPHDRILARFRAMRQQTTEECIVVDSEPETRPPSDSESSVSEDSALSDFTTPSPPGDPSATPIVKCTSETDLYYRKPAGKENSVTTSSYRSVSTKKGSRLPAPTSHKKPLIERND